MNQLYVLDDNGEPRAVEDVNEWAAWFKNASRTIVGPHGMCARHVAKDVVGDYTVSTIFLGLDHSFLGEGRPILWETMVFGPEGDIDVDEEYFMRQATRADAAKWHEHVVASLREKGAK